MTTTAMESEPAVAKPPAPSAVDARVWLLPAIVLAAHLPLAVLHLRNLWEMPHYQFFPFVLGAVGYLVWRRWPEGGSPVETSGSNVLLTLGVVILVPAVLAFSPWLGAVAAILSLGGVILSCGDAQSRRGLMTAWLLLWLLIPPPLGLAGRFIEWMQQFTTYQASGLLDAFGLEHLLVGNIIEFPGHSLFVAEACSGVRSLIGLLSLVAVAVVWFRVPPMRALLLLIAGAFWAALTNIARVMIVAAAAARWDMDLSTGWPHQILGLGVIAVAMWMVYSTNALLILLGEALGPTFDWLTRRRRRRARRAEPSVAAAEEGVGRPPWMLRSWGVAAALAALGVMQLAVFATSRGPSIDVAALNEQLQAATLPEELGGWKQVGFQHETREGETDLGEHSKVWTYQGPSGLTLVSFDYPFTGWHELMRCYQNRGWTIVAQESLELESEVGAPLPCIEVRLTKASGEHGHLVFGILDSMGRPLEPPTYSSQTIKKLVDSPTIEMFRRVGSFSLDPTTYQVQAFTQSETELPPANREEIRQKFQRLSDEFRRCCAAPRKANS